MLFVRLFGVWWQKSQKRLIGRRRFEFDGKLAPAHRDHRAEDQIVPVRDEMQGFLYSQFCDVNQARLFGRLNDPNRVTG